MRGGLNHCDRGKPGRTVLRPYTAFSGLADGAWVELFRGGGVDEPHNFAVRWLQELRRKLRRLVWAFEHALERERFVGLRDHENHEAGVVGDGSGHGHAPCIKLADPVRFHEPATVLKRFGAGEKRKHVAFVAHADQSDVETRKLTGRETKKRSEELFVFLRGLFGIGIFRLDAMHLLGLERELRQHRLAGHAKVAVFVVGWDTALVAEENVSLVPRHDGKIRLAGKKGIKTLGSRAARERDGEAAVLLNGGVRGGEDEFSGA